MLSERLSISLWVWFGSISPSFVLLVLRRNCAKGQSRAGHARAFPKGSAGRVAHADWQRAWGVGSARTRTDLRIHKLILRLVLQLPHLLLVHLHLRCALRLGLLPLQRLRSTESSTPMGPSDDLAPPCTQHLGCHALCERRRGGHGLWPAPRARPGPSAAWSAAAFAPAAKERHHRRRMKE